MIRTDLLQLYQRLGLTPIPLKPRSKVPLGKWSDGWNPTLDELAAWGSTPDINWAVRCGENLAVLDFDSDEAFHKFMAAHNMPPSCPIVRTGRGFHIWARPKEPLASCRSDGFEVKGEGSYVVAPPSVHPSGKPYTFEVAPEGVIPEVDLEKLLGLGQIDSYAKPGHYESIRQAAPSDFALRYGKSPYPRSLCGLATKVLTRSDGKMKHLVSMRDWKWDCPKCAPLLKRHWMDKLKGMPFKFILRLPTWDKPSRFLQRLGKPRYVHAIANGESWLFLLKGEAEVVWAEACRAGYELVAGDIAGNPTPEQIEECLGKGLCREEEPLNTRRKVTHSRGLLKKVAPGNEAPNESNQQGDCSPGEEKDHRKAMFDEEPLTWDSEVVMKPIEEVANELETQGWQILWQSEVEALAIRGGAPEAEDTDIVELIENLDVKLKKMGKKYVGLCPFHDDHKPSLSVNRDRSLWHCFGCGKGGNARKFVEGIQTLARTPAPVVQWQDTPIPTARGQ